MENFLKFLEVNHLKKAQVAEMLGVSKQYISQLSSGVASLSEERVMDLTRRGLDVSMFSPLRSKVNKSPEKKSRAIPLLPFSAVAGWMTENNGADSFKEDQVMFSDFSERGATCAIRVDGNSMWPRYNSGDILAIRVLDNPTFFQWGRVYCLSTTQGCVVKRLFPDKSNPDNIICHSENSDDYPDYTITKSDVLAVAIVVGHAGVE